tara:strand:- start:129 stop:425 length:297 start_codon:yes stop_codon:yes gene_type:complete
MKSLKNSSFKSTNFTKKNFIQRGAANINNDIDDFLKKLESDTNNLKKINLANVKILPEQKIDNIGELLETMKKKPQIKIYNEQLNKFFDSLKKKKERK